MHTKHAHGYTHGKSLLNNATTHTHTLTYSSGLRSHISTAFHLAHYQNGNLSVAVSRPHTRVIPTNYSIHCLSGERKEGERSSNRFSQQDQGCWRGPGGDSPKSKIRDVRGLLLVMMGVRAVTEGGTEIKTLINLQLLRTNFWQWMKQVSEIWVSCVLMQHSADQPFRTQLLCGILRLAVARWTSWRLAPDYWVSKFHLSLWEMLLIWVWLQWWISEWCLCKMSRSGKPIQVL